MSALQVKLLIFVVTTTTVASQLLLKQALTNVPKVTVISDLTNFLLQALSSPLVYLSLTLQVLGYVGWMVIISHEKLGVAVATSGSLFYVLVAISAWFIHDERLTVSQWIGILLVTAGVVCLSARQGAL